METRTKLVWCITSGVAMAALIACLALLGCERKGAFDLNTKVRPSLDQLVMGGELSLDQRFNNIIRRPSSYRRYARQPLNGLHEVLKGSNLFRGRTATYVPLGAVFSSRSCDRDNDRCPGRVELVEALSQSGMDAVSLAAPAARDAGDAALRETREQLERAGICAAAENARTKTCELKLGETRVSLGALSAAAAGEADTAVSRAQELVNSVRSRADLVVLAVALDPEEKTARRQRLLDQISDQAKPDVVLGHFDGPFDGVEIRDGRLILHNPGTMLSREKPSSDMSDAFLFRLHFSPKGLSWAEGIPIRLLAGRSRQAFLDNAQGAVADLQARSAQLGGQVLAEFGRAIVEIRDQ